MKKMLGKLIKGAARGAYKKATLQLQGAAALSTIVAPGSKVSEGLRKAATPFKKGGMVKKYKGGGIAIKGHGKAFTKKKK